MDARARSGVSRTILIGGGVRSGKSSFALARALSLGRRRAFIATAQALDDEMRTRIAQHVQERGVAFSTIEAPFDLPQALGALRDFDVAVIDCLTLWLSNLLVRGDGEARVADDVEALANVLTQAPFPVVLVTNEVGMGVVPDSALGRTFRDVAGRAHQRVAAGAHELYLAAMGCIVRLHPGPVALERRV
jgi:adenosylcobinamide kinase/adenosylcobinamide-phosphate guanylyltransferase